METDIPDESTGKTPATQENSPLLSPVSPFESGEDLPYAPENWPNPGDNWVWKVGKRAAVSGHYLDRYLYLPSRLCSLRSANSRNNLFRSKLSVEKYIQATFPDTDVNAFFSSFSWKIPAKQSAIADGFVQSTLFSGPHEQTEEHSACDSQSDALQCKAGNMACSSLILKAENSLPGMPRDLCCSEPGFCRDCCCILCSKTVDSAYRGYGYIKCQEKVDDENICGHVAHLDCARRSSMAGTVGGSFGLDAEYFCRRCDGRTDLVFHFQRLLEKCKSMDSRDDIEKVLELGVCLLNGSQKNIAKRYDRFGSLHRLECGAHLQDISRMDDDLSAGVADHRGTVMEDIYHESSLDFVKGAQENVSRSFQHCSGWVKLQDEIDQILQAVKNSQEFEYNIVEERLQEKKKYLQKLYQQQDKEKSELASRTSSSNPYVLFSAIMDREYQIRRELKKLRDVGKSARGMTPKDILKEHFGLKYGE